MSDLPQSIFTVSRLNSTVRLLLEQQMGRVWLVGELSNLTQHGSGHWYFTLKDAGAQVRCAMFRGSNRLVSFRPQNGLQVLVQAQLSLYEARGEYQLIIDSMRPAGDGLEQMKLEQLRQRLQAEGLFATERKRPLPPRPKRIGLITSPTGAAVHDLLTVLKRRAPGIPVLLYPAQVQGEFAPQQLVAALQTANRRQDCDVLIIGRGGGAKEDLACFNDESVVRAIAASRIPIVSAVGHESDTTLADFAADLRAPTPSAAAELVSPDQQAERQGWHRLSERLKLAWHHQQRQHQQALQHLGQQLQLLHPQRRLQQQQQRLDDLALRLQQTVQQQQARAGQRLEHANTILTLSSPLQQIQRDRAALLRQHTLLRQLGRQSLNLPGHQLSLLMARLDAMSPLATLGRGYSLTTDAQQQVLKSVQPVQVGELIHTRLADGTIISRVERVQGAD